jgi:hypothetical protein
MMPNITAASQTPSPQKGFCLFVNLVLAAAIATSFSF